MRSMSKLPSSFNNAIINLFIVPGYKFLFGADEAGKTAIHQRCELVGAADGITCIGLDVQDLFVVIEMVIDQLYYVAAVLFPEHGWYLVWKNRD